MSGNLSEIGNFEIGRILHLKFETRNLRSDSSPCGVWAVHSEISSFEFEMQDSSNFKFPDAEFGPRILTSSISCWDRLPD